jgi:hypothetical protein
MSQNLQNFAKFQKFQLDNLVDFEKCCKTHIFLQKSVPIQPKTSNILPKFCQKLAITCGSYRNHLLVRRNLHEELEPLLEHAPGREVLEAQVQGLGAVRARHFRVVANFWQNFGKMLLVFGCIGTDFCK